MIDPKVSVCIPIYNGEKYLKETLDSVAKQSFKNFELVISDDFSSDNSIEVIISVLKCFPNINYSIYKNKKKGIGNNWNNCLIHARGEYIKFIFQDDLMYPNCLETLIRYLDLNNDVCLVSSKREIITDSSEYSKNWIKNFYSLQSNLLNFEYNKKFDKEVFQNWFFNKTMNIVGEPSCVLFRKSIIKKIGLFNIHFKQYLDFEYWYRIAAVNKLVVLEDVLVKFRVHDESASFKNSNFSLYKENMLYHRYFLINYYYLFEQKDVPTLIRRGFNNKIIIYSLNYLFKLYFIFK